MSEFDQYIDTPEEWSPPTDAEFDERENLNTWLLNADCEDQFVIRHGIMTSVYWNKKDDRGHVEERENWTDSYITFSPRGTYLATFHRQGIALWGGKQWKRIARFQHRGVKLIDFSPCERFLVTWSNEMPNDESDPQAIIVWDIKTGERKRSFFSFKDEIWPAFRWSCNDRFMARLEKGKIALVDTEDFHQTKPVAVPNIDISEFAWSPSDSHLAFWMPEVGERPARVVLLDMPSRDELAVKNLYNVSEVGFSPYLCFCLLPCSSLMVSSILVLSANCTGKEVETFSVLRSTEQPPRSLRRLLRPISNFSISDKN